MHRERGDVLGIAGEALHDDEDVARVLLDLRSLIEMQAVLDLQAVQPEARSQHRELLGGRGLDVHPQASGAIQELLTSGVELTVL